MKIISLKIKNVNMNSKEFSRIIEEIKEVGFYKGAKYIEPNYLNISIKNLKKGINNRAYTKKNLFSFA